MRYYIDTEFIEDGRTIELISIGIVSEDGREHYAINYDCDFEKASNWVKENVLSQLPEKPLPGFDPEPLKQGWRNKGAIAHDVAEFCGCEISEKKSPSKEEILRGKLWDIQLRSDASKPEFWGYYADYDWVVFCQLFGTMMDLPKGFPRYCRDIKQLCDEIGNPQLPEQGKRVHNALADARWNKQAWEFLRKFNENFSFERI
jgi:hypothetical protein